MNPGPYFCLKGYKLTFQKQHNEWGVTKFNICGERDFENCRSLYQVKKRPLESYLICKKRNSANVCVF